MNSRCYNKVVITSSFVLSMRTSLRSRPERALLRDSGDSTEIRLHRRENNERGAQVSWMVVGKAYFSVQEERDMSLSPGAEDHVAKLNVPAELYRPR